jgi:hypothetical protein
MFLRPMKDSTISTPHFRKKIKNSNSEKHKEQKEKSSETDYIIRHQVHELNEKKKMERELNLK